MEKEYTGKKGRPKEIAGEYEQLVRDINFSPNKATYPAKDHKTGKQIRSCARPCLRHYENPMALAVAAARYFDKCVAENKPITKTKTALNLGFASPQKLREYKNYSPTFYEVIGFIELVWEGYVEELLYTAKNPAGAIFGLKQFDWKDKVEVEQIKTDYTVSYNRRNPDE